MKGMFYHFILYFIFTFGLLKTLHFPLYIPKSKPDLSVMLFVSFMWHLFLFLLLGDVDVVVQS